MAKLSQKLLQSDFSFPAGLSLPAYSPELPEKVIQFGEGNFLRAFVDWMFHRLNQQGLFNGRIVVVQPIAEGLVGKLNDQDGLYTLLLRGLQDGRAVEQKEVIRSISRGINPYTQWQEYLRCAGNPDIEFVISNTTEAGITFDASDRLENTPPVSFPGKLTAYLYHRFQHFQGDPSKGMVMIPCELIDRNGDTLKKVVLKLAAAWRLPSAFTEWVEKHNLFLNSLVDRVVTGYPRGEIQDILARLGYEDDLVNTGELFHLWVIEGPQSVGERLPFTKVGLNVVWTDDMTPYRTRKVRILNGAHTASVPAAFLYGLETVGEMMDHAVLGRYVRQIVADEIVPSIDLDKTMLTEFAASVIERFQNPYIQHYLISILLNSSSKFKARVLPSILEYRRLTGKLPVKLTFSLAALLAAYKNGVVEGTQMKVMRGKDEFTMKDDLWVLEFFAALWAGFESTAAGALETAQKALANADIWGQDLNEIPGLAAKTGDYLWQIVNDGMQATVDRLVK
ncbi:Hypothetical protein LUCI_0600 [Lucifera butyrica]|uniref:Tagaturonate reductase n=1 Tax=Lucifera butyrica TaxID=1351585 RepID=A0A498R1Y4_9FIRM|nr:tagaturonate reductase [Lucifera butyrica]VBB05391.1 Hypothetical protein LUCI_0600 [Lucifera butyrica]